MAEQHRGENQSKQDQDEYMRGGKGRKDEVGGSGIYPASSPNAPGDAEVRSERDLVRHKGPRPKTDQSAGSE